MRPPIALPTLLARMLAVCALLASVSLVRPAPRALADAAPVELVLLYLPNVSNTGTKTASGIAELVMSEGEVRIAATGLPHLDGDARYLAWLVNSQTNEFQRLGAFNADESDQSVRFDNVLPDAIPNKHWNLLLLSVEASAEPARPSNKHSLAATFPSPDQDQPPALLPNTGGAPDDTPIARQPEWLPMAGLAALAALLGFGAGYGLGSSKP